jgi:hypothetical protein
MINPYFNPDCTHLLHWIIGLLAAIVVISAVQALAAIFFGVEHTDAFINLTSTVRELRDFLFDQTIKKIKPKKPSKRK